MPSAMSCPSCHAVVPVGATLCEKCGAPMPVGIKAQTTQRVLTPEAATAICKAGDHAGSVATALGPEKIMALGGGFLGVLGALLPFYRVDAQAFIGPVDLVRINLPTPSLAHAGAMGAIVILVAIVCGIAPFITQRTRAVSLVGFGLAATILGMVLGDLARSAMFGRTFGDGFYYTLTGFALLSYLYAQRAHSAPA